LATWTFLLQVSLRVRSRHAATSFHDPSATEVQGLLQQLLVLRRQGAKRGGRVAEGAWLGWLQAQGGGVLSAEDLLVSIGLIECLRRLVDRLHLQHNLVDLPLVDRAAHARIAQGTAEAAATVRRYDGRWQSWRGASTA